MNEKINGNISIRKATTADIDALIKLRLDYLTADRGSLSESEKSTVVNQLIRYFPKHISDGFISYLGETDNYIAAGAFLVISEKPANPAFITGKVGTILNVFTYPEYRRRGIASSLLEKLIEEARTQSLSFIELSATESGKPLYEKLGFQIKTSHYTEMILHLENQEGQSCDTRERKP